MNKFWLLLILSCAGSAASAADCSMYPNAKYEAYWGFNRALAGQTMCASYGMSSSQCSSLGGDFKENTGSGSDVCFLEPGSAPASTAPRMSSSPSTSSGNGRLTFSFTNSAPHIISLAFYSDTRKGWVWPSSTTHYDLTDRVEHSYPISCNVGEHICYGAWYSNMETIWGVGYQNKRTCTDCCLTCGTVDEDRGHSWVLGK